jgi:MYXO-CTERM domain-containing protein
MTFPDCTTQDCALGEGTCVDDSFGVRCEPRCPALPPEGGVIDETGSCFNGFGPNNFWRSVEGAGWDGGLLWTNAFENETPSNWARWQIELTEPGEYELEVYLDPTWAVYPDVRYQVTHDGGDAVLSLDQSAGNGWAPLGTFSFSSGASLSVFDNTAIPVPADQHIAVDAIRLTRVVDPGPGPVKPDRPTVGDPGVDLAPVEAANDPRITLPDEVDQEQQVPEQEAEENVEGGCGCTAAPARDRAPWALLLLTALALRRRRREKSRR